MKKIKRLIEAEFGIEKVGKFALILVILSIIAIFIVVIFFKDYVDSLVAFGTLMLAIATAGMVYNSQREEKRDRKERILLEISQWAEDTLLCVDRFRTGTFSLEEYAKLLRKTISIRNMTPKISNSLNNAFKAAREAFESLVTGTTVNINQKTIATNNESINALIKEIAEIRADDASND